MSTDGLTLAVGAIGEDSMASGIGGNQADNSGSNPGAVYLFARSGSVIFAFGSSTDPISI